jgi:hypothetical protein
MTVTDFLLISLVPALIVVGVPFALWMVWLWWDDRCHQRMMGAKWDGFVDGLEVSGVFDDDDEDEADGGLF